MGLSWYSSAEIITTKPEELKFLIESFSIENNFSIYDLKVQENSIIFNSGGYGIFGSKASEYSVDCETLFKYLSRKSNDEILCFEIVKPCQDQGYLFFEIYVKGKGTVDLETLEENNEDWSNDATLPEKLTEGLYLQDLDDSEHPEDSCGFQGLDIAGMWFIPLSTFNKEEASQYIPNLTKFVNFALNNEFDDWFDYDFSFNGIEDRGVTFDVLSSIYLQFCNEIDFESTIENDYYKALDEANIDAVLRLKASAKRFLEDSFLYTLLSSDFPHLKINVLWDSGEGIGY